MTTIVRMLRLVDGGAGETAARTPVSRDPRVRVAIASRDGKGLNAHFGFAEKLMVYDVTRHAHRLVQVIASAADNSIPEKTESEDGIGPKIAALGGCHLLFVLAIGPRAAARVIRANIHPIKVADPEPVDAVILRVQTMMNGTPPPWLEKVLTTERHP